MARPDHACTAPSPADFHANDEGWRSDRRRGRMTQKDGHNGTSRSGAPITASDVLALTQRGALVAIGGTVLLADAGGRLLASVTSASERQARAFAASVARVR